VFSQIVSLLPMAKPRIFLLRGEKIEDARSRTADDKYWQITAKDGEIPPTHDPFNSRL